MKETVRYCWRYPQSGRKTDGVHTEVGQPTPARRDILHADCIDVGGSWTSGYEARSALASDAAAVYLIALSTLALIVRSIPRLKLVWMVPRGCWVGIRTVSFRVTYSS